ncbi:MAG: STAS domain-containing protein [Legionellales bacterium]|nr:STAS domain-containing protein [Legionellales bacterium]
MTKQSYFKPSQNLTFATVTAQRAQFAALLAKQQSSSIHCDLTDVQLCDSAGLAFLIDARRMCQSQNSNLVIAHASVDVIALAKLYGIEKILDNDEEQ